MIKSLFVALLEIRNYIQDKGDLAFSLLLPIATFALMYGAFGGESQFNGTAHVVNEDQGGVYSTRFVERLGAPDSIEVELLSLSQAETKLERSDVKMVIYIPEGFSDKLESGQQAQMVFKQRGNGGLEGQIIAGIGRSIAGEMAQELQVEGQVKSALAGRGIPLQQIEITVQKFLDLEHEYPLVGITQEMVGSSPDMVNMFLPGIVTMYVLFAITLSARALVEERRKGTLERLLTTRLTVGQLFLGKFLANVSRGFLQTLILLALSYAVFQMFTPLSFGYALVIALVFTAAVSALGLVIGSVARSPDAATWTAVFFTMLMVMLAGTFFEIEEGTAMATASVVSINTYANDALKAVIAEGSSLADVGLELGILAGVAVVGLAISRSLFKATQWGKK